MSFESLVARQPARPRRRRRRRADDIAIWKFTTGSTGQAEGVRPHGARARSSATRATPAACSTSARTTSSCRSRSCSSAYARDLAALFPFGVGATGVIFAERTTPELIFELIARHRPTILVNVPTMMQAMLDHPERRRPGPELPSAVHVGRRGAPRTAAPPLGRRSSASRCSTASARPRRITSTSRTDPAASRPGTHRRGGSRLRTPRSSTTTGRPVPDGQIGRLWVRGESAALMYWGDEDGVGAHLRRRPGHERRPRGARSRRVLPLSGHEPTICSRSAASGLRRPRSSAASPPTRTSSSARWSPPNATA